MSGGSGGSGAGSGGGAPRETFAYVASGAFGAAEEGKVTVFKLNRETASLDSVGDVPAGGLASFMAFDLERHRAFVADEENGGVVSFAVEVSTGKLSSLGATPHSNHPVNLAISPDGKFLLGANYNEGSVDLYPISVEGKSGASVQTLATGSHAHGLLFDAQGRLLVSNEGSDNISHVLLSGERLSLGTPATSDSFSPRHMALGADGKVYVVSERGDSVTAYSSGASGLAQLWQEKRLDQGSPTDNTGGDIHLTPNGKFLYATNRGTSNTIVGFDISGAAPVLLGHVSSEGTTPRNFTIDPEGEFLLVANHGTKKSLAIFRIGSDGKLTKEKVVETDFTPYFVSLVQYR